jgi:hypothetical protein
MAGKAREVDALRARIAELERELATSVEQTRYTAKSNAANFDRAEAAEAKVARLREALTEINRRSGLLMHQNTGRWDATLEHDRRTVGVIETNMEIARAALKDTQP